MTTKTRHFVTFYSPGTFVAESTTKEITAWDTVLAIELAAGIVERYGARPFGFRFTTRGREDDDFDSKETAKSGMYYLGGTVQTLTELEAKNDPSESILLSNMRANGWDKVIVSSKGWRWSQPLKDGDIVLNTALPGGPE